MYWFDWLMFAVVFVPFLIALTYLFYSVFRQCFESLRRGEDLDFVMLLLKFCIGAVILIGAVALLESVGVL